MYKVVYEDKTEFLGGDLQNSKWNKMPSRPITAIYYKIPNSKQTLVMKGYESYNHHIERGKFLDGSETLIRIILMGKFKNIVHCCSIDLKTSKIDVKTETFGRELRGGVTTGWKEGKSNRNPQYYII